MRRNYLLPTLIVGLVCFTSCKKWLDVQPQDRFTEPQVFTDEPGANLALNGLYLRLASGNLYGNNLTMGAVEIFAQRYNIGSQHSRSQFQVYNYSDPGVMATMDNIWTNAYVTILNANEFLKNLDKYPGIVHPDKESIMRGEAIGIRALLHFDMLRIFGPRYSTADSTRESIPYYTIATKAIQPLLPATEAMDKIEADLLLSSQLLANDPIVASGVLPGTTGDGNDFYRNRNQRMNYYAVKALQARVYLYRGKKAEALEAARLVIDNATGWFPWVQPSSIISERSNPDRIMSTELLFAAMCIDLYDTYRTVYSPDLADGNILAPNDSRLKTIFENNENDYRYNPNWILGGASKSYKTFYKYADVIDKNKSFRYLVPLIRISEMYYIAAECETDPDLARTYLNTVRYNRGLTDLPPTANINTELMKEYQKEFYGEGQLFFFYKRRNITSVPNSASTSGNTSLNTAKYVVPLPLSETTYR
jgi:hypothetical protein